MSAAMVLAQANVKFLLIERGEFCGAKNVSGGILWGSDLSRLIPLYWEDEESFERFINHRRLTFLDETSSFSIDFKSSHFDAPPYSGISVLRARFDAWLADKVQAVLDESLCADESFLATNVLVDEVLKENGRVIGIRAGSECFYADCVILAEGVNNLLTRQLGLLPDYVPADLMSVGVKEVLRFDRATLENRFQLHGRSGITNEFIGFASQGVEGGGFLYTNLDSVSIGLVLSIKSLREKRRTPQDLLNAFKSHPALADLLRDGKEVEYSAHAVSAGDLRGMPSQVFGEGFLIAGEAAGLLLNAGRAIQGMDYAMRSGILAAETVIEARSCENYGAEMMSGYRTALENCYVLKDMRAFQNAVHLLHSPSMFTMMPDVLCEFGRQFFTVDNAPTKKSSRILHDAVRKHGSYWDLVKLGFQTGRSL